MLLSSCDFPVRYINGCPESKILSLKYPHLQLLIRTSQFYMGSWHNLLKRKHCYFFNLYLPWMKIWRWRCSRYIYNHDFLLCEKFQSPKFRYTEVIHKNLFLSFLEMHNYVWYFWTCPFPSLVTIAWKMLPTAIPVAGHICY